MPSIPQQAIGDCLIGLNLPVEDKKEKKSVAPFKK